MDKVFCEDCRWCVFEGSHLCSHENFIEPKKYITRNIPLLDLYPFCDWINKNGECEYFEMRDPTWWERFKVFICDWRY